MKTSELYVPEAPFISVALCTCNGARHLQEQLRCIADQRRLPDELVVCDDASTDDTQNILQTFAKTAPFPVRIQHNEKNMGVVSNFQQAIGLCEGDLISLCDQDDIWHHDKLAMTEQIFKRYPKTGLFFHNGEVVDESSQPLGYRLSDSFGYTSKERRALSRGNAFHLLLRRPRITGATLTLSATYRNLITPIPEDWMHDEWIALVLSAVSPTAYISTPLIRYRQHDHNQLGAFTPGWKALLDEYKRHLTAYETNIDMVFYLREARRLAPLADCLKQHDDTNRLAHFIEGKEQHVQFRSKLPERHSRRIVPIVARLMSGQYARYSDGWKSALLDMMRVINRDGMNGVIADLLRGSIKNNRTRRYL